MNSETPRVDEVVGQREFGSLADSEYVRLARQLERELAEMIGQRDEALAAQLTAKDSIIKDRDQWKAVAQEVISKFQHRHVNNGTDDACKQCGFDLRHEIHERFNEQNK